MTKRQNIHATGLVLGRRGIMLRGPSGAGKSILTLALLDEWQARGRVAKLLSDDRLEIEPDRSGIVMHAPAAIAGLIELRGRGIVRRPYIARARLHLVVDLVPTLERMVEEDFLETRIEGVSIARCPVPAAGVVSALHQLLLVREALRALPARARGGRQIST